jgi:quinol monooxygenase YgiN
MLSRQVYSIRSLSNYFNMHSLTVVAKITARTGKEQQTRQALEALVPITQGEEGCMQYDLHVSGEAPGVFLLYENWTSQELWQKHMQNDHLKAFIGESDALLARPVEVSLWHLLPVNIHETDKKCPDEPLEKSLKKTSKIF